MPAVTPSAADHMIEHHLPDPAILAQYFDTQDVSVGHKANLPQGGETLQFIAYAEIDFLISVRSPFPVSDKV